jgi:hypothetical protein
MPVRRPQGPDFACDSGPIQSQFVITHLRRAAGPKAACEQSLRLLLCGYFRCEQAYILTDSTSTNGCSGRTRSLNGSISKSYPQNFSSPRTKYRSFATTRRESRGVSIPPHRLGNRFILMLCRPSRRLASTLAAFWCTKPWAGLVHPPQMRGGMVPPFIQPFPEVAKVWKTEEKGSDVNLGSHLVRDAFQGRFDVAAVLSNDTDLVEPIRIVVEELGLPVRLLCPVSKPAGGLANVASFVRHIRFQHLQASQFPDIIPNTSIARPPTWC